MVEVSLSPGAGSVAVTLNGLPRTLAAGTTVAELVATVSAPDSGVAVAVNDKVVPRAAWASTELSSADRVEVLTAMRGG